VNYRAHGGSFVEQHQWGAMLLAELLPLIQCCTCRFSITDHRIGKFKLMLIWHFFESAIGPRSQTRKLSTGARTVAAE